MEKIPRQSTSSLLSRELKKTKTAQPLGEMISRFRGFGGKGGSSIKGKEKEMRDTLKRNHDLSVKVSGQIGPRLKCGRTVLIVPIVQIN